MRAPRRGGPELRVDRRQRTQRGQAPPRPVATVAIRDGDCVVLDFGALYDGYHSDMTRTVAARRASIRGWPTMFDVVEEAQAAGRGGGAGRRWPGPTSTRPAGRSSTDAGCGEHFTHGTGHGVGLLIHEVPWATASSVDTLPVGDVVTVEPGVYRAGLGGVRIEDTVLVTERRLPPAHAHPEGPVMPAISTNDLKNGITLQLDNGLFTVVDFQHVKPGKGGAFVRTKLKNVRTGAVLERTFRAGEQRRAGHRRQARHAVPLPRRRRLRLHGQRPPTTRSTCRRPRWATPPTTWSSR